MELEALSIYEAWSRAYAEGLDKVEAYWTHWAELIAAIKDGSNILEFIPELDINSKQKIEEKNLIVLGPSRCMGPYVKWL